MRWRLVGTLAFVVGIAVACSGGTSARDAARQRALARANQLAPRVLEKVPKGYDLQPPEIAGTGPSDLEKAIGQDGTPDARIAFTRARFTGGYQRLWHNAGSNEQIAVLLYAFRNDPGAQAFGQHALAKITLRNTSTANMRFDPAPLPGSTALSGSGTSESQSTVLFVRGRYFAQVVVVAQPAREEAGLAALLARAQYDLLASKA